MECRAGTNQANKVDVSTLLLVLEEWITSLQSEQMSIGLLFLCCERLGLVY